MDEQKQTDIIQTFDSLFTSNKLQMYKVLLPCFESSIQQVLSIYIKYMELLFTIRYFMHYPYAFPPSSKSYDLEQLCAKILPYCTPFEKQQLEKAKEMFANFSNMQEILETINMMQEMFPEGFAFGDNEGSMPSDMMQMFQMFNSSKET